MLARTAKLKIYNFSSTQRIAIKRFLEWVGLKGEVGKANENKKKFNPFSHLTSTQWMILFKGIMKFLSNFRLCHLKLEFIKIFFLETFSTPWRNFNSANVTECNVRDERGVKNHFYNFFSLWWFLNDPFLCKSKFFLLKTGLKGTSSTTEFHPIIFLIYEKYKF